MAQKNLPELAWPGRPGGISFGSVPRDAQLDFWGGQKSATVLLLTWHHQIWGQ